MPSSVIAQVVELKNQREHINADRLEIFDAAGWQIVCGKGIYKNGDKVVYITPDSLIAEGLGTDLGIIEYLKPVKNADGSPVTSLDDEPMFRVREAKMMGEPSFGTTISRDVLLLYGIDIEDEEVGTNLADVIGIMKYEPHMK